MRLVAGSKTKPTDGCGLSQRHLRWTVTPNVHQVSLVFWLKTLADVMDASHYYSSGLSCPCLDIRTSGKTRLTVADLTLISYVKEKWNGLNRKEHFSMEMSLKDHLHIDITYRQCIVCIDP